MQLTPAVPAGVAESYGGYGLRDVRRTFPGCRRPLPPRRAARPGRHGPGLAGPRRAAAPRRRHQGADAAARPDRRRAAGDARADAARGARDRPAQPPERGSHLRHPAHRRRARGSSWSTWHRGRCRTCWRRTGRCRCAGRPRSASACSPRSGPHTARAWCTATSSPATCCSATTAAWCSPTSAWPRCRATRWSPAPGWCSARRRTSRRSAPATAPPARPPTCGRSARRSTRPSRASRRTRGRPRSPR